MAPRSCPSATSISDTNLDGSQGGLPDQYQGSPGSGGIQYGLTRTSEDSQGLPNPTPYWGDQGLGLGLSATRLADKSSVESIEYEKHAPNESFDDATSPRTTSSDRAHEHRGTEIDSSAEIVKLTEVLRNLHRTLQQINYSSAQIALVQALASGLSTSKSAPIHHAPHIVQGMRLFVDEVLRHHKPTKPTRLVLDWEKIYPELYPSALIPLPRQLVGGVGWSLGAPCAACVKNRPDKTKWLSFEEASKVPEYIGSDGRLDMRKMPKDIGILHNPGRCRQLHEDVNEHIAAKPSDMWMLKERLLPAGRP